MNGLANNVAEDALRAHFARFGTIAEFVLPVERHTGMNRGYAYISFVDIDSTTKCLEESTHQIGGRSVTVTNLFDEECLTKLEALRSKKLFVSFLGVENVTEHSFRQAFSTYGCVSSVHFARDEDGKMLYYAIVNFEDENAVDSCLEHNHCINGRSIAIRKAVTKEQFKLAEQSEREKAHLEEHQRHGYAGYGSSRLVAIPHLRPNSQSSSSTTCGHLTSVPGYEHDLRNYELYRKQMEVYQHQLAEYHRKMEKYQEDLRQYQIHQHYKDVLDQAAFHKAYNYNTQN